MKIIIMENQVLPELPVFGFRMIMPTLAEKYQYEGLSGETYPDRKAGAKKGIYIEKPHMTPYLTPQDCGMHMDTKWVTIYRNTTLDNSNKTFGRKSLQICSNQEKFNFSCLPYTACEIENATHLEELPCARRTVLCIYGATRGVGGINSWGADVEDRYHVSAQEDMCFFVYNKLKYIWGDCFKVSVEIRCKTLRKISMLTNHTIRRRIYNDERHTFHDAT